MERPHISPIGIIPTFVLHHLRDSNSRRKSNITMGVTDKIFRRWFFTGRSVICWIRQTMFQLTKGVIPKIQVTRLFSLKFPDIDLE